MTSLLENSRRTEEHKEKLDLHGFEERRRWSDEMGEGGRRRRALGRRRWCWPTKETEKMGVRGPTAGKEWGVEEVGFAI